MDHYNNKNYANNNYEIQNINQSMPIPNNAFFQKNSFNYSDPNNRMLKSEFNYTQNKNNFNKNINEEEYYQNNNNDNINNYNDYNEDSEDNNGRNNEYYNNKKNINRNKNINQNNNSISEEDSESNINLNAQYFSINKEKEKEKINRYQKMIKSEIPQQKKNQEISLNNSISSEEENKSNNFNISNNQSIINKKPLNPKFKYKSDFDHNGALYYLGTKGLTKNYENPHKLKLIKAFGSSLLSGNFYDFVGRKFTDLSTENEENSFFGIDLGPERYLIPTAYSIKNRDSDKDVLLCWNFQGSNDKINFEILDKRIFMSETDEKLNDKTRKCRHMLKKPKTTSTWGVSKSIREKYPDGFRYFLLKQIGKNSSNNYNLAISGFELYGEGVGSGWIFN